MSTSKLKWVQRELEDQIDEELGQSKNFYNLKTNLKTSTMSTSTAPQTKINVSEVLSLLGKGYSRLTKHDKTGVGSIQTYYKLTGGQVKELFNHPKLKGKKTKVATLEIVDDAPDAPVTEFKPKKAAAPKATATAAADEDLFK